MVTKKPNPAFCADCKYSLKNSDFDLLCENKKVEEQHLKIKK